MARDQLQQVFGIEARFEHDVAAAAERQHAVGVRRRMVHRPVHQDDLVFVRLDAIGDGADPRRRPPAVRAASACAARPWAGRWCRTCRTSARCRSAAACDGCMRCRASRSQSVMPSGTRVSSAATLNAAAISGGVVTTSSLIWRRQAVPDLRQQIGMADQNVGAAVGQDIADLVGLQVPVDRHHRAAERGGRA